MHLSTLDPDTVRQHLGGVGAVGCDTAAPIHVAPVAATYAAACAPGRTAPYVVDFDLTTPVSFYVVYAWSGATARPDLRDKSENLLQAIVDAIGLHPERPTAIVGDYNIDLDRLEPARRLMQESHWADVGHHAHLWGQPRDDYTCMTGNAARGTRRDFFLVNPELFGRICNFRVLHDQEFPTHAVLQLQLRRGQTKTAVMRAKKP